MAIVAAAATEPAATAANVAAMSSRNAVPMRTDVLPSILMR